MIARTNISVADVAVVVGRHIVYYGGSVIFARRYVFIFRIIWHHCKVIHLVLLRLQKFTMLDAEDVVLHTSGI